MVALIVVAIVVALRSAGSGGYTKSHLVVAAAPLLLATVAPLPFVLPFAFAHEEVPGWARSAITGLSAAGIVLSFLLFAIGTVLTVRAARASDSRMPLVLATETALASLPAVVFSLYALVMLR